MRNVVHSLTLLIIVWLFAAGGDHTHMVGSYLTTNGEERTAVGKADMSEDKDPSVFSAVVNNVAVELADFLCSFITEAFRFGSDIEDDEESSIREFELLLQPNIFFLESFYCLFAQPIDWILTSPYFKGSGKPG